MKTKTAVVLVHGFTGDLDTWKNSAGTTFLELLQHDKELSSSFYFVQFEYYTKLLSIFHSAPIQKILGKIPFADLIPGISGRVRKNRPISKLSEELATFIDLHLGESDEVILIGHSMGGLIAKDLILNHEAGYGPTPSGYISLAVPHKGSLPAVLLSPFNLNASELRPLDEYCDALNNRWTDLKTKLPPSIYVVAQHDECVPSTSSVPFTVTKAQKAVIAHDHTSICKPESRSDAAYLVVKKFLANHAYQKGMKELTQDALSYPTPTYDKEIFVLKMMVCAIGKKGVDDAKDCFFNAELVAKSANKFDLAELQSLQRKVHSLYRQKYNSFHGKEVSPNDIFSAVHAEIASEDKGVLDSSVEYLNFLHKKGLLHQLANNMRDDVVWSDSTDFAWIENGAN